MTLYIIVPVFNNAPKTALFLAALLNQTYKNFEVLVVNDGSTDETPTLLKAYEAKLKLNVIETQDRWWGGSINVGLDWLWQNRTVGAEDFIALANNDTRFAPDFLQRMMERSFKLNSGFCHPCVIDENNRPVSCGARLLCWFPYVTSHPLVSQEDALRGKTEVSVDYLTARFLLAPQDVFKRTGKIPEALPHYQGDYYLTYKAKQKGFKNFILTDVSLQVDNSDTGLKTNNLDSLNSLWRSFSSIRSANNLKHRSVFVRSFHGRFFSSLVLSSMVFNIFAKFILKRLRTGITS